MWECFNIKIFINVFGYITKSWGKRQTIILTYAKNALDKIQNSLLTKPKLNKNGYLFLM